MVKPNNERCNYIIKVPYENNNDLDNTVDEIMSESGSIADLRNGFVEMDIVDPISNRSW